MAVRLGFCVTGAATTRYAGAGTREWRNGSRAGFRFLCLMTCGFESHLAHPAHPFLQHPIRRRRVQPRRKAVGRALRFRRSITLRSSCCGHAPASTPMNDEHAHRHHHQHERATRVIGGAGVDADGHVRRCQRRRRHTLSRWCAAYRRRRPNPHRDRGINVSEAPVTHRSYPARDISHAPRRFMKRRMAMTSAPTSSIASTATAT